MSESWSRFSKSALIIGACIAVCGLLLGIIPGMDSTNALYEPMAVVRFLGIVTMAIGLPGVHGAMSGHLGKVARIGFIFMIAYLFLWAAEESQIAVQYGMLDRIPDDAMPEGEFLNHLVFIMSGLLTVLMGGICQGIALARSTWPTKAAGWVILLGAVGVIVGRFAGFAGMFWLHYVMTSVLLVGWMWMASGLSSAAAAELKQASTTA